MPPKAAPPPKVELKNFTATFRVSRPYVPKIIPEVTDPTAVPPIAPPLPTEGVKIKIFSTWCNCSVTSPTFGTKDSPLWTADEDQINESISFTYQFEQGAELTSSKEKLLDFHDNPNIYPSTLTIRRTVMPGHECFFSVSNIKPLMEMSALLAYEPIVLKFKNLVAYPRYPEEDIQSNIMHAYLYANLRLQASSSISSQSSAAAASTGGSSSYTNRRILVYPSNPAAATSSQAHAMESTLSSTVGSLGTAAGNGSNGSSSNKVKHPFLDCNIILLPGLLNHAEAGNLTLFYDQLSTATYTLHLYQDDLTQRCLGMDGRDEDHPENAIYQEYIKLLSAEPGGLGLPVDPATAAVSAPAAATGKDGKAAAGAAAKKPAAAAPAAGGKDAAPTAAGAIEGATFSPVPTTLSKSEQCLLDLLLKEMEHGREIRPHGGIRVRFEQLLEDSNDLIAKFQALKKKQTEDGQAANVKELPDHVQVKQELGLEVRCEKPSKPEKWDLPSDLSLKKALKKHKEKQAAMQQLQLATSKSATGNMLLNSSGPAAASAGSMQLSSSKQLQSSSKQQPSSYQPPRHELYLVQGTYLTMTATLYRPIHPQPRTLDSSSPYPLVLTTAYSTKEERHLAATTIGAQGLDAQQVQARLNQTPFTRMLIKFPYTDDETLRMINAGVVAVNSRALPDIQGSIRSYSLTAQERAASIAGQLDVLSGVMILDDDHRLVILEGLAAPDKAMETFYLDYLPKLLDNADDNESSLEASQRIDTSMLGLLDSDGSIAQPPMRQKLSASLTASLQAAATTATVATGGKSGVSILINPYILFNDRVYPDYSPDLKRIRIRSKLEKLARRPELYNRKQVKEICYLCLDNLMSLRRCKDIQTSKLLNVYPSPEMLNTLELLYGEAISRRDMDGTLKKEYLQNAADDREREELDRKLLKTPLLVVNSRPAEAAGSGPGTAAGRSSTAATGRGSAAMSANAAAAGQLDEQQSLETSQDSSSLQQGGEGDGQHGNNKRKKLKEATNCRNADFEDYLAHRPLHRIDYLAEQRLLRKQAWLDMLHRREEREEVMTQTLRTVLGLDGGKDGKQPMSRGGGGSQSQLQQEEAAVGMPPKIYLYSIQSQNFKEKAWSQLRQQVKADHSATYTFSKDFISQNVTAVDISQLAKQEKAISQSTWLTSKGFQYPKPKTFAEIYEHPNKPSEARIEDLKEAFSDLLDKKPNGESLEQARAKDPALLAREQAFRTQIKGGAIFGALSLPAFEHDFTLKYIGDREAGHLPRGSLLNEGEKNEQFFRSVHLGGENQARIVQEALEAEKQLWQSKVIVDDIAFKVGGLKVRDRPLQMDRAKDILHDEAKRQELKFIRSMKSASGKSLAYETTPLTLLNKEPYAPNAGQKLLARTKDQTKFITATMLLQQKEATAATGEGDGGGLLAGSNGKLLDMDELQDVHGSPKDFTRYIHQDTDKPKILTMVAKRKHPPLDKGQDPYCAGPKWEPA